MDNRERGKSKHFKLTPRKITNFDINSLRKRFVKDYREKQFYNE